MEETSNFVVVSNRLPVSRDEDEDRWVTSPGGLVSALVPILREHDGVWIGWTGVPEFAPPPFTHDDMRLHAVALDQDEMERYYLGFCNNTLWPLYHNAIRTPQYHRRWWHPYRLINERFADQAGNVLAASGVAWVHDYQLQLVPQFLRERRPDATIGFFLHIPFPPVELYAYLPWRESLLEGLLGADVLAFQTEQSVNNFRDAALRYSAAQEAGADLEYAGRKVTLQWAPISIDAEVFARTARRVFGRADQLRKQFAPVRRIMLAVDRLDYTKGIDHRLRAVQTFHARYGEDAANTVLLQVAVPSREELIQYSEQREGVERLVGRINGEYGRPGYTPVVYMYRHFEFEDLVAAYVAADVMLVTPLCDGMNLIAKEYVASRTTDDGLLVLSEFAGAASELSEALLINPLNLDKFAETLRRAVHIAPGEAATRMRALRETVHRSDVFRWSRACIGALES
ncbi:MAG: trehalose-6-phosphate synthase [Gemmatimonadetes bacterium]|nr:trehalose-6-phosphate synthase [Gemmatimonadota bacterium]